MNVPVLIVELAEKMGLLASAALLAVLLPPLRAVLIGQGRALDKLAAVGLGLGLSVWGATLGLEVSGEHINLRAIGVLIAAILGGPKAGALAGIGGGVFAAARADAQTAPWVLLASVVDGILAGAVAKRYPAAFHSWRAFLTSVAIQTVHLAVVGALLLIVGNAARFVPAWPAHLVKILINAAGVTLFVLIARLVVMREQSAVLLAQVKSQANNAALEALRHRLEPHFLFNALNALRATIRTNPERARAMVSDLADLYRYILSHGDHATLKEEFDHARAYLAVERIRLGDDKLTVQAHVPPELYNYEVVPLFLQPWVANAVKHGVSSHDGAGVVTVSAALRDKDLVIEVQDQSLGAKQGQSDGAGIALSTLRERLDRRYGTRASLQLLFTNDGARSILRLPALAQRSA